MPHEDMIRFLHGEPLEEEKEDRVLAELAASMPDAMLQVARRLLTERRSIGRELAKAKVGRAKSRAEAAKATKALEDAMKPPLQPGTVLRRVDGGRLDVVLRGGRQIVGALPALAETPLRAGDEVWLDPGSGIAVARGEPGPRLGRIGTVAERLDDRIVVRGEGDEDTLVLCAPDLAKDLDVGDRILYAGEFPCALERLPDQRRSTYLLAEPPRTRFDDIGGLDHVIDEVRSELDLHLFHPQIVEAYRMKLMRGMTLVGPPGVGKTLFAGATAGHLADVAPETRFMNVGPGSLRGQYYGQTESRILELFAMARSAPGLVVMFFDELDHFGARGTNSAHDVDDRVMGTLLAEINGLQPADNVFVIGATNRLELIDEALVRQGRFGDRIVEIPRPNREATGAILRGLLVPELPWEGDAETVAEAAVAAATSYLFAPAGGSGVVVHVTFVDGAQEAVRAPQLLSGALLASSVERAKKAAAQRELEGGNRLGTGDVTLALDQALAAEARKLSAVPVARRTLSLPRANEITRVEVPPERHVGAFSRLRAA